MLDPGMACRTMPAVRRRYPYTDPLSGTSSPCYLAESRWEQAHSAFEAEMLTFPRGNASCGLSQAHDTGTGTDAATLIARTPESNADLVD